MDDRKWFASPTPRSSGKLLNRVQHLAKSERRHVGVFAAVLAEEIAALSAAASEMRPEKYRGKVLTCARMALSLDATRLRNNPSLLFEHAQLVYQDYDVVRMVRGIAALSGVAHDLTLRVELDGKVKTADHLLPEMRDLAGPRPAGNPTALVVGLAGKQLVLPFKWGETFTNISAFVEFAADVGVAVPAEARASITDSLLAGVEGPSWREVRRSACLSWHAARSDAPTRAESFAPITKGTSMRMLVKPSNFVFHQHTIAPARKS